MGAASRAAAAAAGTEIKIRRSVLYGNPGGRATRRLGWTYEYTTPVDIEWTSADGTTRPGPRAGEYISYGRGLAGLRSMLRRKFPGARLTETWKAR